MYSVETFTEAYTCYNPLSQVFNSFSKKSADGFWYTPVMLADKHFVSLIKLFLLPIFMLSIHELCFIRMCLNLVKSSYARAIHANCRPYHAVSLKKEKKSINLLYS